MGHLSAHRSILVSGCLELYGGSSPSTLSNATSLALAGPQPPAPYLISQQPSDNRVWCTTFGGALQHSYSFDTRSCLHPTLASQQPLQPPADLVPAVVIPWDPIRPWRSHQPAAESQQDAHAAPAEPVPAQQSLYIAGTFTGGGLDPMTWGFGSQPVHHFVVKAASLRHRIILERIRMGDSHPRQPLRPAIWANTPGAPEVAYGA